jgi:hypothetical protein
VDRDLACTSISTGKALPMTGRVFTAASASSPTRFYPFNTFGAAPQLRPTKFRASNGVGTSRLKQCRPPIGQQGANPAE